MTPRSRGSSRITGYRRRSGYGEDLAEEVDQDGENRVHGRNLSRGRRFGDYNGSAGLENGRMHPRLSFKTPPPLIT